MPDVVLVVLVALAVLALVGLGLGVADRRLARLAERQASAYLAEPFGRPPTVRVHATPFLTQALRGRYRDVEVSGGGLQVGEMSGATLNARLINSWLPLRDLLGGRTRELPCEQVRGHLLLPYAELARVSRVPGLALTYERGRLIATAALPVPGISQLARVSGQARLAVEGNAVRLRVSGLSVAGISLTTIVLRQLLPRMNVPIPLPALPWGLHVDDLEPVADGLLVHGSASAVVFRPVGRPSAQDEDPAG